MRLIDADRLLSDRVKSTYYHLPNGDTAIPIIDIEHTPTIEERKNGKWIETEPSGVWTSVYHCSECGGSVMSCKVDLPKYCGHCGAKMEENDAE